MSRVSLEATIALVRRVLPVDQAEVLFLRLVEGLSVDEVATLRPSRRGTCGSCTIVRCTGSGSASTPRRWPDRHGLDRCEEAPDIAGEVFGLAGAGARGGGPAAPAAAQGRAPPGPRRRLARRGCRQMGPSRSTPAHGRCKAQLLTTSVVDWRRPPDWPPRPQAMHRPDGPADSALARGAERPAGPGRGLWPLRPARLPRLGRLNPLAVLAAMSSPA